MNCDEFEQSVLAEPGADNEDRQRHASACADCSALLERVMRMERRLQVLMAVPVPASINDDLPDMQSLDSQSQSGVEVTSLQSRRREDGFRTAPVWLAMAAAVALVAVFVLRQPQVSVDDRGTALAAAVVEHIGPELGAMRPATTRVDRPKLTEVLSPAGATLDSGTELVSYAKSCVINGKLVPHLVVQGEKGPVTVLLMPDEPVDGPVSFMRDGLEGVILPVGDSGSIAIIGRDAASVEAVSERTRDSVDFTI